MMKRNALAAGAALLVAAGALAGCASRSLRVEEYILTVRTEAAAEPAAGATRDPVIGVGPIDVPGYLRRPEIVMRGAEGSLDVRPSERWGEDLGGGFARALAGDLASLVPSSRVVVQPFPAPLRPDVVVAVQILRFEPTAGGPVELDAQWVLELGGRALAPRRVSLEEPVAADTTPERVAAMSRAIEALAARVAAQIRESLATR
jgi:uncharacterized lipoprotein YmbA